MNRPPDIWNLKAIITDPLEVQVRSERSADFNGVTLLEREVTFRSERWRGKEIRIAAHVAMPAGEAKLPALIIGHGHGGAGSMDMARGYAAAHHLIAVSIDGPGQGDSSGPRDCMGNWLDVLNDPRDSYLYHYAVAGMRAVTYVSRLPECDPNRLGVTGGSMGGIMTLLVNGVDTRLACAIDNAACGAWAVGAKDASWIRALMMEGMGLQVDSPAVATLLRNLDPALYIPTQHSPLLIILGAQDEFFPITSLAETVADLHGRHRLTYIADWDHGLYTQDNPALQTYDNTAAASLRVDGSTKRWIDYYLHGKGAPIPRAPVLRLRQSGGAVLCRATVDDGTGVKAVRLCYSTDGAYTFDRLAMGGAGSACQERLSLSPAEGQRLAAFVEVECEDGLFLSSRPVMGPKFRCRVRPAPFNEATYVIERSEESAAQFLETLRADPSLPLDERLWWEFHLAGMWAGIRRYEKAAEVYQRVLEQAPSQPVDDIVPVTLLSLAQVYVRQGAKARAIEALKRALEVWPTTPDAAPKEIEKARALLDTLSSG